MCAEMISGVAASASLIAAALRSECPSSLSSTNTVIGRPTFWRSSTAR
jgi:hypothetical protein